MTAVAMTAARKKAKVAPAPEPELDIYEYLPMAIAILVCWLLPIVLAKMSSARAPAKAKAAVEEARHKTYVIIGASTGIGLELVKQLGARGGRVIATVRKTNEELTKLSKLWNVKVIQDIDVTSDQVGALLKKQIGDESIDVLVCNAGSYDGGLGGYDKSDMQAIFGSQKLDNVTAARMHGVFEVNTIGPLRVVQALNGHVMPGGKIAIISTQMGSIDDNTSGGSYAYRASKAAVNMVGKGLSCDLKSKEIAVQLLAPGFVVTGFGPGAATLKKMGAKEVTPSVRGIVQALDAMTMANTGCFVHTNYGQGLKNSAW